MRAMLAVRVLGAGLGIPVGISAPLCSEPLRLRMQQPPCTHTHTNEQGVARLFNRHLSVSSVAQKMDLP